MEHTHMFSGRDIEPPQGLSRRIYIHIQQKIHERKKRMFLVSISLYATALAGVISGSWYLWENLRASSFYTYLSLIGSDGSLLLSSWKEFGLSLLESFPTIEIALILAGIVIILQSVKKINSYNNSPVVMLSA